MPSARLRCIAFAACAATVPAWATGYNWSTGTYTSTGLPATLAVADTLAIVPGGTKNVTVDLVNLGTVAMRDNLLIRETITNGGLFDLQGDFRFDEGTARQGSFINNAGGILRKSAGTGSAGFYTPVFINNGGTIDAQTGSIGFPTGTLFFNDGTKFTGAGRVVIGSNTDARFTGTITSTNLTLSGGSIRGTGAVLMGSVNWSGGSMTGDWQVASGQTLNIQAGSSKSGPATLVNNGLINAADSLLLDGSATNTLTNNGTYDMQGNVGISGGRVVNNGLLVKSAGAGIADFNNSQLTNNGTLRVSAGTFQLPGNFVNAGSMTGGGTFFTFTRISGNPVPSTLTNNGHIAPGDGIGTLSLTGNLVQGAGSFLDAELQGVSSGDQLLVTGTVVLGGTLALHCFADCKFAAGDQIVILDSTGDLSGSFASVTLDGFATGAFNVIYDTVQDRVLLQVTQAVTAAVPEAQTWALMLAGLGVVGWVSAMKARRCGA